MFVIQETSIYENQLFFNLESRKMEQSSGGSVHINAFRIFFIETMSPALSNIVELQQNDRKHQNPCEAKLNNTAYDT